MMARGWRRPLLKKGQSQVYRVIDRACPALHPGEVSGVLGETLPSTRGGGLEPGSLARPEWGAHAIAQGRRRAPELQRELGVSLGRGFFDNHFERPGQIPSASFPRKEQALDEQCSGVVGLPHLASEGDQCGAEDGML